MQTFQILHRYTNKTLYSGPFKTFADCAEAAIHDNVCLDYADLSDQNLTNACLDGFSAEFVTLQNTNLIGANLSESRFHMCDFINTDLQAVCAAFSVFSHCDFTGAICNGLDIAGASVMACLFSTESACALNYRDSEMIDNCYYRHRDDMLCRFSKPPLHITGLEQPITVFDDQFKIGNTILNFHDVCHANDNKIGDFMHENGLYSFIQRHKNTLINLKTA